MELNLLYLTLLVILTICQVQTIHGYKEKALALHNRFRAIHHAPALSLSASLNGKAMGCAQYYANRRKIDHSCPYKGRNGENLYSMTGSPFTSQDKIAETAVNSWYNEVKHYRYSNPTFSMKTGHFTQVVWKGSRQLGFGIARNGNFAVAVALYSSPGNFQGRFSANVIRP